jgi:hypothetical protein
VPVTGNVKKLVALLEQTDDISVEHTADEIVVTRVSGNASLTLSTGAAKWLDLLETLKEYLDWTPAEANKKPEAPAVRSLFSDGTAADRTMSLRPLVDPHAKPAHIRKQSMVQAEWEIDNNPVTSSIKIVGAKAAVDLLDAHDEAEKKRPTS